MTTYPDVPDAPGVPPLLRNPQDPPASPPELINADDPSIPVSVAQQQWGIFKDGVSVVEADSVVAMEYSQDWSVSNFPVEKGGFDTYNKVNTPFDVRLRFAQGGSEQERNALIQSIMNISGNLELYDFATPEVIYSNVNVQHYNYQRTNTNGVGLIQIDVWGLEIRQTGEASFTQTQAPSGANQVNNGTVQTLAVPDTTATQIFQMLGQ